MISISKAGLVAIVGRPNVGKSTILNLLLNFKLAIVSPKPQTTRHKILGVLSGEGFQAMFLDTPGMLRQPRDELDHRLVRRAIECIDEADLVVLVVEPFKPGDIELRLIQAIKSRSKPTILAINKVDLVKKPELLPIMDEYNNLYNFLGIVPLSALRQDGIDILLNLLITHLPAGEPLFGPEEVTSHSERFLVAELVREQVCHLYGEEIPFDTAVEIEEFREASPERGGKDYIRATIYVNKDSQKGILIGSGGALLKQVGVRAREQIEAMLGRSVYLELWVKTYPKWRKDPAFLKRLGY